MKSSLGFHTMTLFRLLTRTEAERLIKHFVRYQEHMGLIEMHMVKSLTGGKKEYPEYKPKYKGTRLILPPIISVLHSDRKDHGIRWTIRCDSQDDEYSEYTLEAKVNPKILGDVHDYITAANCVNMDVAIANFNRISRRISPLLGTFECYKFKRVDYCVNFDLSEIAPGCTPEQVIELIKRADIPSGYKMWMFYDETAHRMKSDPDSFYLKCGSVNINCYRKAVELQQRAEKAKGDIKEALLEASRAAQDVIRFEVQCKYPKVYALSRQTGGCDFALNKYFDLLGYPNCLKQINDYYKSTIGGGDWFSLPVARRIVKAQHFNSQKEKRLLDTLYEVNRCRSLAMAKVKPQGSVLEAIKRSQKDLADIGINCQRHFKMSFFAEMECRFLLDGIHVLCSLIHQPTRRLEACQALIYQLVLGLTGKNGKYNYPKAVHLYPPFFDIFCSAKNYKIAPALTQWSLSANAPCLIFAATTQ